MVSFSKENQLILYPENRFRFIDLITYRPYVKSILTENPWIISLYDRKQVFVIKNNKWVNADIQTYGASIDIIVSDILGYNSSISATVYGNVETILNDYKNGKHTLK